MIFSHMTATIRILPSGREFNIGPHESVLDGALRAGISIPYSCNSGACGECKARLVSGHLAPCSVPDYQFSAAEKAAGYFLTCHACTQEDLEIEVREAGRAEDMPLQQIETRVAKIEQPHPDVMVVHLRTPRSQSLRFLAGQHAMLEIPGLPPRNKSIASCPCNAMNLQFHIQRVPGDPFAEYCFSALKLNQAVKLTGPSGYFTFDDEATEEVIFLAYDTGFAPIKSLIEHAISLEYAPPIRLYWVASRAGDHYLENLCRSWLDALDNFYFTPLLDEGAGSSPFSDTEIGQLLGAQRIVAEHPDLSRFRIYMTGPEHAVPETRALLLKHGLPAAHLHIDSFHRF